MDSDFERALRRLPHGEAFRFVDDLTSLDGGHDGTAVYQVRGDEAFLAGHFPGNPLMPGVILIEAIAQLGGIVAQTDPDILPLEELRLSGVRSAKILGAAAPGSVLEIRAKVEGRMGGLVQIAGEVAVAGCLMASARVTLSGSVVTG